MIYRRSYLAPFNPNVPVKKNYIVKKNMFNSTISPDFKAIALLTVDLCMIVE
jgi:hypothetical protein